MKKNKVILIILSLELIYILYEKINLLLKFFHPSLLPDYLLDIAVISLLPISIVGIFLNKKWATKTLCLFILLPFIIAILKPFTIIINGYNLAVINIIIAIYLSLKLRKDNIDEEKTNKKNYINKLYSGSSYWISGGKIGILILFFFYLFCLTNSLTTIGPNTLENFTLNILNPLSIDIFGIDFTSSTSGWISSYEYPSILGWLYLSSIFFLLGAFFGSFIDIIKRKVVIVPVLIILITLFFGVYISMAHFADHPFRCNLLFEGDDGNLYLPKSTCLLNYVASNEDILDGQICMNLKQNEYDEQRSKCFLIIAERTGDPTYCDNIDYIAENIWEQPKEQCYSMLAKKNDDASICSSGINKIDGKCITEVAIKQNNHSICEKIISTEEKDNCYLKLSLKYHNSDLCEKINNSIVKNKCTINSK